MHKIYVASSWRNDFQQEVVRALREAGNEVYDFKNPREGDHGFHWSEIDSSWKSWTPDKYVQALNHDLCSSGFKSDFDAMKWADTCVLVLPCGRSAHLEGGYFTGANKKLHILLDEKGFEPELMYLMATSLSSSLPELMSKLAGNP